MPFAMLEQVKRGKDESYRTINFVG
jgi:hypothetical protein